MPLHRTKETFAALLGGAETFRPLDDGNPRVPLPHQIIDRAFDHFSIIRCDHVMIVIEGGGTHSHICASDFLAQGGKLVVFRDRRKQQDAVEPLLLEEIANVVEHFGRVPIDRADHQRKLRIPNCVEHALLEIEHGLRVRIVVQQADQEVATQGQSTRLGVRNIAEFSDDGFDFLARILLDQRRTIDDPADGLLGHAGDTRDIVDRRCLALFCHALPTTPFKLARVLVGIRRNAKIYKHSPLPCPQKSF